MRSGSAPPRTAFSTAAASAWTRASRFAAGSATSSRQPASCASDCQRRTSSVATTTSAGVEATAEPASRLIMAHARRNLLRQLLDFIGLLQCGERKHVAVVLFELQLHLL